MAGSNRIEVHVRIRPRLESLGETFLPPAARKHTDTSVSLDMASQLLAQQAHDMSQAHGGSNPASGASSRAGTPRTGTPNRTGGGGSKTSSRQTTPLRSGGVSSFAPIPNAATPAPNSLASHVGAKQQVFTFDGVCDAEETQAEVFEATTVEIIDSALEGRSGAVMCYGPTGTGKTYTLLGETSATSTMTQHMGLLPRTVMTLLEQKEARLQPSARLCGRPSQIEEISLVAAEVYLDDVRDLLAGSSSGGSGNPTQKLFAGAQPQGSGSSSSSVKVSDHGGMSEMLRPFKRRVINSMKDYRSCNHAIATHRAVCSHEKNSASSRSHAIFFVELRLKVFKENASPETQSVWIALVDLAGSERVKRSQVEGHQLAEAQAINKSLSALCTVVTALYHQQPHIPYRDSKLTRLLRPCFEHGGQLCTLVHIPPSPMCSDEAAVTLKFAERMKQVALGDTGIKNAKSIFTKEELELEASSLERQRSFAELCSDLRVCNATNGYVLRRIANSGKEAQLRFKEAFNFQREQLESLKEKERLRDETVTTRLAPTKLRVQTMKMGLEKVNEEVAKSRHQLAELSKESAVSADSAAWMATEEVELVNQATKKAKRSKQVALAMKATLVEHMHLCKKASDELEAQRRMMDDELIKDQGALSAELRGEATLDKEATAEVTDQVRLARQHLGIVLTQGVRGREQHSNEYLELREENRTMDWSLQDVMSKLQAANACTASSTTDVPPSSTTWKQPLVLSNRTEVQPKPTLLGTYDDRALLAKASYGLLQRGIPVLVKEQQTGARNYRRLRLNAIGNVLLLEESRDILAGCHRLDSSNKSGTASPLEGSPPLSIPLTNAACRRLFLERKIDSKDTGSRKILGPLSSRTKDTKNSTAGKFKESHFALEVVLAPYSSVEIAASLNVVEHKDEAAEGIPEATCCAMKQDFSFFAPEDLEALVFGLDYALGQTEQVAKLLGTTPSKRNATPGPRATTPSRIRPSVSSVGLRHVTPPRTAGRINRVNSFSAGDVENKAIPTTSPTKKEPTRALPLTCRWSSGSTLRSGNASTLPVDVIHEVALAIRHFAESHTEAVCSASSSLAPTPRTNPILSSLPSSSYSTPSNGSRAQSQDMENYLHPATALWREEVTVNHVRTLFGTALGIDVFRLQANWDRIILSVCHKSLDGHSSSIQHGLGNFGEGGLNMVPDFSFPPIEAHLKRVEKAM